MASSAKNSPKVEALKLHLESIQWSEPYPLEIEKVADGSLGIVVDTFPVC